MGTVIDLRLDGVQIGVVDHLDLAGGFGYVRTRTQRLIFVVGRSITHVDAKQLAVGNRVRIRVSGRGRIDELQPWPSG